MQPSRRSWTSGALVALGLAALISVVVHVYPDTSTQHGAGSARPTVYPSVPPGGETRSGRPSSSTVVPTGAPPAPGSITASSTPPAGPVADQFVTRSGSGLLLAGKPWRFSGVNMYWLGLDENVRDALGPTYPTHQAIDAGFRSAAMLGSRLVRSISLGVSVGSPRSLEPQLGTFNDAAFASIDYAVATARRFGLRLMIPLIDNWHFYTGGKHTFTSWLGYHDLPGQNAGNPRQQAIEYAFYYDPRVIAAFDAYIAHILDHVNPLTGLRLGDDPTIAIWEEGNELADAPSSWVQQTAQLIKAHAPHALVAMASTTAGYAPPRGIDIVDQHFYPPSPSLTSAAANNAAVANVAYMVGEYPVYNHDLKTWLESTVRDKQISGTLAWSLFPYLPNGRPETHDDGYTFHYPASTAAEAAADALLIAYAGAIDSSS